MFESLDAAKAGLLKWPWSMPEAGFKAAMHPHCILAEPPKFDFDTVEAGKLDAMLDNAELWFLYRRYLYCSRRFAVDSPTQENVKQRDDAYNQSVKCETGIETYVRMVYATFDPAQVDEMLFESPRLIAKLAAYAKRQGILRCLPSPLQIYLINFEKCFDKTKAQNLHQIWLLYLKYLYEIEALLLHQGQLTIDDMQMFELNIRYTKRHIAEMERLLAKLGWV